MNLERFVKLMIWLSKRYPGAYIDFWESEETAGLDIWDSEENKKKYLELWFKGHAEENQKEYREFEKKHLKVSFSGLNREEI